MIEVNQVTKQFGTVTALDNVTFAVKPGEIVGFLGPNGAGKTTAMRIITGYFFPTSGSIRINNKPLTSNLQDLKHTIGYLPEHNPLYLDLYVHEYLQYIATIRGLNKGNGEKAMREVIQTCKLENVANQIIGTLSKGYRQRVGLAQALIHDPSILILDEPTSGLDPNQIVEIRQLIKNIGKEKTVILSTHILPEVSAVCDRALIINQGKIVAQGSIDELENHSKGNQKTTIILRETLVQNVAEKIKALPSVTEVKVSNTKNNTLTVTIQSAEDIREKLFSLAVHEKWNVLELYAENASLEDVFRKLTTQ